MKALVLARTQRWCTPLIASALLLINLACRAQHPEAKGQALLIEQEVLREKDLLANLRHLSVNIGARLTGTSTIDLAHTWAEGKFKEYGLAKVRRETYDCVRAWSPGLSTARVSAPIQQELNVAQFCWTAGTQGPLRASLVQLPNNRPLSDADCPRFRGKVLLLDRPDAKFRALSRDLSNILEKAQPSAILVASEAMYRLAGSGNASSVRYLPANVPIAAIDRKESAQLQALLEQDKPVEIEINLRGPLLTTPCVACNTLAEIPGAEKPEEILLVGAHLDSVWVSPGASDDAAGVVALLEAARALRALKEKPRRTIRFVLFSGEEQGFLGSKAYLHAHANELNNHQAVLILDGGAGRIQGFGPEGWPALQKALAKASATLKRLGQEAPILNFGSSDQEPFRNAGVPAFLSVQQGLEAYLGRIHSPKDTAETLSVADLRQCASTLAATALELANLAERLPHR